MAEGVLAQPDMAVDPRTGVANVFPARVSLDAPVLVLVARLSLAADGVDIVRSDAPDAVKHHDLDKVLYWHVLVSSETLPKVPQRGPLEDTKQELLQRHCHAVQVHSDNHKRPT